MTRVRMCRNIRTLHNFEPPATEDEICASALQFVKAESARRALEGQRAGVQPRSGSGDPGGARARRAGDQRPAL